MSGLPLQWLKWVRRLATDQEKSDFSVPDAQAFRLGYLKAPTEMILIMSWAWLLPSSDEVMCRHGVL